MQELEEGEMNNCEKVMCGIAVLSEVDHTKKKSSCRYLRREYLKENKKGAGS